jgi:surface antigen
MLTRRTLRSAALVLLAGAAAMPLTGCEMLSNQTGMSRSASTGAVTGGAAGGIIALLADANPAWVAASVVLGGVTGGVIGDHLGKQDAETHAQRNLHALDTLAEGQTETWSNSKTGHSGSTTIRRVGRNPDGSVCKEYTETIRTGAETTSRDATACRTANGGWAVRKG